ncbi:hypothetical protein ASE07_26055 [Noviherbaspirillum sp. Root189]|nr:hypothetical protein ASE07_26055 [Noviherbaspirillum sp. Root189]
MIDWPSPVFSAPVRFGQINSLTFVLDDWHAGSKFAAGEYTLTVYVRLSDYVSRRGLFLKNRGRNRARELSIFLLAHGSNNSRCVMQLRYCVR